MRACESLCIHAGSAAAMPLPPPLTPVLCNDWLRPSTSSHPGVLRLATWNIERGYKLAGLCAELARLDADAVALQEVDWACERSGLADCGRAVAEALGFSYAFVAEFEELRSPLRDARTQGGGLHGQALLSRWPLQDVRALLHSHQPVDWAAEGEVRREPRRGARVALAATVDVPGLGELLLYSLHLEVFSGITSRLRQIADVLGDARQPGRPPRQAILGDLNTMAHSVARLSPLYCCDSFRWRSLGQAEASFWAGNVWCVTDTAEGEAALAAAAAAYADGRPAALRVPEGAPNVRLLAWRLPSDLCVRLTNPGFADPFDVHRCVTLNNPTYWGLMKGKLDWGAWCGRGAGCVGESEPRAHAAHWLQERLWRG